MKQKRKLAFFMILVMLCSLTIGAIPVAATANETADGFKFDVNGVITGYNKTLMPVGGVITIPSSVTDGTTTVVVTSIGSDAFSGCTGLTSVTIPNGVTSIRDYAFFNCGALASVTIPNGVTSIGECVFMNCTALASATIPDSVTSIGIKAFTDCSSLTSMTIPSGTTSIKSDTFAACRALASVTIPSSVTSIGTRAFDACNALTSVTIPSSVTSIGESAFNDCKALTSVTIPSSVTSIGVKTFAYCDLLTSAAFLGNAPATFGADVFRNVASDFKIIYDNSSTGFSTPTWNTYSAFPTYDFNASTGAIVKYNGSGGAVVIPDKIGGVAVTSIGETAFNDCTGLTNVIIPDSVTSIGNAAFYKCTGLTSVTIPNGITSIGDQMFFGCKALTSVTIPNGVTSIGNQIFWGCIALTSVTIPDRVTSIGQAAFYNCTGLTSVTIPNGVTSIGTSAFTGCTGLTSVTIPNGVTRIEPQIFFGCNALTSVTIPDSVTSIGDGAFDGCKLKSVTIPSSVTSIGNSAFYNCTGLTSVTIPSSVTSIGNSVFYGCKLKSATFLGNAPATFGSGVFPNSATGFKIIYDNSSTGFTTPKWNGYDAFPYCTVTYDKNGGDTDATPTFQNVNAGGSAATLPANPARANYTFEGWNTAANGSGTAFAASTAVTGNLTVYAQYKVVPAVVTGGGSSSSGGGGGVVKPATPATPETGVTKAPKATTAIAAALAKTDASGNAAATVTGAQISDAIAKAVAGAKAQGADADAVVEIKVTGVSSEKSVLITIPQAAFSELSGSASDSLRISTPLASVEFNAGALDAINAKAAGDIKITAAQADVLKLSDAQKKAVGNRPVYDFTLTSGNTTLSNFGEGSATVRVPYTLAAGEDAGKIVICYLAYSGELVLVSNCSYDAKTGLVSFTTNHFSNYVVSYNDVKFSDVTGWYAEHVNYLAARGIINGSNGQFNAGADMTRAQFVTLLAKLSGADLTSYKTSAFTDVQTTDWYFGAAQWAHTTGVSAGIDGKLDPNASITRQDMAVMIARYAQKSPGHNLALINEKTEYADSADIAVYAAPSVTAMQQAGILAGSDKFAPKANATRAEAAKMISVLLKGMIL